MSSNCALFFALTKLTKGIFRSEERHQRVSCELLQPIVRAKGGVLMDVYQPETECKPYILTIQMEGQSGLEEVGERAIEEFASVVAR